jgi:crossover junction endodeoxyribonuclease RusA
MSVTSTFYTVDVGQAAQWLTANQRLYWRRKAERTKAWREATAWRARHARIPRLDRALIVCELRFAVRRRRDPANWAPTAKACVDGLVDAGVFDDDDATRVQGPDMRLGDPGVAGLRLLIYPTALGDSR